MPQFLKVGVAQSHTLSSTSTTLATLAHIAANAARQGVHILLFPEAYLGGYPRTCNFGVSIGSRDEKGRDQFLAYFNAAVDLGDTPRGAGDDWIHRKLPSPQGSEHRGDGTREELERIATETGLFLVVGLIEKAGGSLYCGAVYVDSKLGCIGKRRKVMPTGAERLVWGQGSTSTLKAVTTTINGINIILGAAICWENYMPLLRYSLYSQNVNLYLAPTADARDTWLSLMRTVALEGRCFVLSANQCVKENQLPSWIDEGRTKESTQPHEMSKIDEGRTKESTQPHEMSKIDWPIQSPNESVDERMDGEALRKVHTADPNGSSHENASTTRVRRRSIIPVDNNHELHLPLAKDTSVTQVSSHDTTRKSENSKYLCRGGSCIVSPTGAVLKGPLWEEQTDDSNPGLGLLIQEIDLDDCIRGRLDFDAAGSYSRNDSFKLTVEGLSLDPPE